MVTRDRLGLWRDLARRPLERTLGWRIYRNCGNWAVEMACPTATTGASGCDPLLYHAASLKADAVTVDIEAHLSTETVDRVRLNEPLAVEPATPVRDVFELLRQRRSGSVLICHDGKLAGIFTERDALRLIASGGDLDATIQSVMVADPVTLRQGDTVATAVRKMAQGGYRRLPIVDSNGCPTGMITVSGIVHYLVEFFPHSVYNLPPVTRPMTQEREGG